MASVESQKPNCPVCKQSDQTKTTQAAYETGVARCAPPDMPTKKVSMLKYILFSTIIVGICVFLIIVLIGGMGSEFNIYGMSVLVTITLVCILTALALSYMAFQRVVKGDEESTTLYPAWDRATHIWRGFYYCSRDQVVFDPQTRKIVSDDQLDALRVIDEKASTVQNKASLAH